MSHGIADFSVINLAAKTTKLCVDIYNQGYSDDKHIQAKLSDIFKDGWNFDSQLAMSNLVLTVIENDVADVENMMIIMNFIDHQFETSV